MLDAAIVVALLAGLVIGWRKGFLVPVVAQLGVLLGLGAVYAGPLASAVPAGPIGLGAGAVAGAVGGCVLGTAASFAVKLLYRSVALRRIDHVLGVPLGAAAAGLTVYVSLVGAITVDGWLKPLHGRVELKAPDIAAVQAVVTTNPAAAAFLDPKMLAALADAAAKAPITAEQLAKLNAALAFYETSVRPAIVTSRIGPLFVGFGADLPLIGRRVEYPTP